MIATTNFLYYEKILFIIDLHSSIIKNTIFKLCFLKNELKYLSSAYLRNPPETLQWRLKGEGEGGGFRPITLEKGFWISG